MRARTWGGRAHALLEATAGSVLGGRIRLLQPPDSPWTRCAPWRSSVPWGHSLAVSRRGKKSSRSQSCELARAETHRSLFIEPTTIVGHDVTPQHNLDIAFARASWKSCWRAGQWRRVHRHAREAAFHGRRAMSFRSICCPWTFKHPSYSIAFALLAQCLFARDAASEGGLSYTGAR